MANDRGHAQRLNATHVLAQQALARVCSNLAKYWLRSLLLQQFQVLLTFLFKLLFSQ
jgi:hypothetical protein